MNRLKISFGVLLLLAVLCISGMVLVHHQCTEFAAQTQAVMDAAAAGDTEAALESCDTLLLLWERFHDVTGVFVDGERLEPIRELLAGLPVMIAQQHPDLLSRLETLRTLAEELFRAEIPDVWHIL